MPECHTCTREVAIPEVVGLWDGNKYCQNCVDVAHPLLFNYASSHKSLKEYSPRSAKGLIKNLVVVLTISFIVFVVPVVMLSITRNHAMQVAESMGLVLGMLAVSWGFVALLILIPLCIVQYRRAGYICVRDGLVEIKTFFRTFRVRLCDISWSVEDESPTIRFAWFRQYVGLTIASKMHGQEVGQCTLICGHTQEIRELWVAFLELARVPIRKSVLGVEVRATGMQVAAAALGAVIGALIALVAQVRLFGSAFTAFVLTPAALLFCIAYSFYMIPKVIGSNATVTITLYSVGFALFGCLSGYSSGSVGIVIHAILFGVVGCLIGRHIVKTKYCGLLVVKEMKQS